MFNAIIQLMIEYNKPITLYKYKLGYMCFYDSLHPLAQKNGRIYYHRHVASFKIGRWLTKDEDVHHIDGDRANNNPDNLMVVTKAEHLHEHLGYVLEKKCPQCDIVFKANGGDRRVYCSIPCRALARRKVIRPSLDILLKEIEETNFVSVGKKYGVSDNAIRKWIKI